MSDEFHFREPANFTFNRASTQTGRSGVKKIAKADQTGRNIRARVKRAALTTLLTLERYE